MNNVFFIHKHLVPSVMLYVCGATDTISKKVQQGIYDVMRFIHVSLPYKEEIDNDAISDVANSWIFL